MPWYRLTALRSDASIKKQGQQTGARMAKQKSLLRGLLAGMAGGLAAAWVMNEFMAGLGQKLQQAAQTGEENPQQETNSGQPKEDATMKAADAIAYAATGEHLSRAEKEKGGPIVHYAFGAITGGLYGGLAEYSPAVTSGFGTSFGGVLFSTADMLAVPALKLAPSPADQPASAQASPFAAHIVYGATTEFVRRILRALF
jgi:putative membrane protein